LSIDDDVDLERPPSPKSDSLDDDDDENEHKKLNQAGNDTTLSNKDEEPSVADDETDIDRELDEYLNDEEDGHEETDHVKLDKLKRLDALACSFENYELFQKMAVERHGLLNKRCRRRIWPLLILYRNRFYNTRKNDQDSSNENRSLSDIIESSLAKFNKISQLI